jgi:UDP-N-acetylmuramoylalanine--D-glutamate ligase
LDRYSQYADYIEAKSRIFKNQNSEDIAVLNGNDPIVTKLGEHVKARKLFFGPGG